ncbi:antirestriction protein ArdA [Clostridium sp. HBUAS56010]|uniref:antirestriction protein ArdA n=1 Tax=Clostridium sp. HBUAS56010 TaxID=2571127 RepID=UPI00163D8D36|nr:antirestriction protein ArdA [Clostridium sp. HBUAS56010]
MIQTMLTNRKRPELPPVPVCFPIGDYAGVYERLQSAGIGGVAVRDCLVMELDGSFPLLKKLIDSEINVEELDYLAKRLESFDRRELAQFQGLAVSQELSDMTDLINLTFCCQEATVVQDFTDLAAVGRMYYMDLHGGITEDEVQTVDFHKLALSLLANEEGSITPYGVVYENNMKLEQCYYGLYFPYYQYSGDMLLAVALKDRSHSPDHADITWLYLPAEDCQIERALLRSGIPEENLLLEYVIAELPERLVDLFGAEENIYEVNRLCKIFQKQDQEGRQKWEAVLVLSQPANILQAEKLLKQIDLFDFIPGISTPEDYGKYMIMESGRFEYDSNLDEFYDFNKYGTQRIAEQHGQFIASGYISYHGFLSVEEVMAGSESERMELQMSGL